jgi:hypothetical protein
MPPSYHLFDRTIERLAAASTDPDLPADLRQRITRSYAEALGARGGRLVGPLSRRLRDMAATPP